MPFVDRHKTMSTKDIIFPKAPSVQNIDPDIYGPDTETTD